jgi:hypothetical protein
MGQLVPSKPRSNAFWHQWYNRKEEDEVKQVILRAWKERSSEQIQIERNAAFSVEEALRSLTGSPFGCYSWDEEAVEALMPSFKHTVPHLRTSPFTPAKETMKNIPYWIDFGTP